MAPANFLPGDKPAAELFLPGSPPAHQGAGDQSVAPSAPHRWARPQAGREAESAHPSPCRSGVLSPPPTPRRCQGKALPRAPQRAAVMDGRGAGLAKPGVFGRRRVCLGRGEDVVSSAWRGDELGKAAGGCAGRVSPWGWAGSHQYGPGAICPGGEHGARPNTREDGATAPTQQGRCGPTGGDAPSRSRLAHEETEAGEEWFSCLQSHCWPRPRGSCPKRWALQGRALPWLLAGAAGGGEARGSSERTAQLGFSRNWRQQEHERQRLSSQQIDAEPSLGAEHVQRAGNGDAPGGSIASCRGRS